MPATEQTWRNQTRLHLIFGVSGVALLLSTLWMFAADHDRSWKDFQKTARDVDVRMTRWRTLQYQTEDFENETRRLLAAVAEVRGTGLPEATIEEFKREVEADARRRGESAYSFKRLERDVDEMKAAAQAAETARQAALEAARQKDRISTQLADAKTDLEAATEEQERTRLQSQVVEFEKQLVEANNNLQAANKRKEEAESQVASPRQEVLDRFQSIIRSARFREDKLLQERKFTSANLDAKRAELGLAVRDNLSSEQQDELQAEANALAEDVEGLTVRYQLAASHRQKLQALFTELTETEAELKKKLDDHLAERQRLETAASERESKFFTSGLPGKRWLELPILDAFNSPLKIDNLWSEGLEQNYNFRNVRRFDRCTTCHQSMTKTMPGSAVDPAYVHGKSITLVMQTRLSDDESDGAVAETSATSSGASEDSSVQERLGIRFDRQGLLSDFDVTVTFVAPYSLAARAVPSSEAQKVPGTEIRDSLLQPVRWGEDDIQSGLLVGDVLEAINGDRVRSVPETEYRLEEALRVGQPVTLTVRRGLPHPYVSHPRLDLFVGSLSPHTVSTFACTICHEGQGSATDFKWASHTPDSPRQRMQWSEEYGWFDNHHWIYPMHPKRFMESSCLKCHHQVSELEPSEKFPDPPAPKLMHGHQLIQKYGCFGCHEINGFNGGQSVGPDLRLEPNYFAAAQALKNDESFASLTAEQQDWVEQLIQHPERDQVRTKLYQALMEPPAEGEPQLSEFARVDVASMLKDIDSPGKLRKVGPSLRFVGHKLDPAFMYDWIREPKNFRPTTRMPQFFELWDHLSEQGREVAEKFEPVEILSTATYLLDRTQDFEFLAPPEGITESTVEEKIERGRIAFQERGCLACHSHGDFPGMSDFRPKDKIQQGPDLTNLADKFDVERNPNGRQWLYTWIKQPNLYHVRTLMPDLFLDPIEQRDVEGHVVSVTDPADDIVEYLLSGEKGTWSPPEGTLTELDETTRESLDELAFEHLRDAVFIETAKDYLKHGIPQRLAGELKGAEKELLVPDEQYDARQELSERQKLAYVGRKTIIKYGCYGCHDIPGFEDAKPIGTGLADWGRKDPARLAFEHIAQYLEHGHGHGGHGAHGSAASQHIVTEHQGAADPADVESSEAQALHADEDQVQQAAAHTQRGELPEFFREQLMAGNRIGFIYQKLLEPRSYDYHKTENKRYNERLRMPMFPLSDEDREAIITFVLGLVAEPPNAKYVYQPDARQKAINEGRQVLEKYNCGGCHVLEGEKWQIAYEPGLFGPQQRSITYPFVLHHAPTDELQKAAQPDRSNRLYSTLSGLPVIGNDGLAVVNDDIGEPLYEDDEYDPNRVEYAFQLFEPTILDGDVYQTGESSVYISKSRVDRRYPSEGGDLAKYLLPHVVQREQAITPTTKGSEAWGWLPPPLIGEGAKVQTEWLHNFLLNPYPIRPAVVLRMPRFNMSPEEAAKLVNYFAARDNVEYPYTFADRRRSSHVEAADAQYRQHLEEVTGEAAESGARFRDAMKIVTNGNYCVQCHIVGDFNPAKELRGKGPDLADVYRRLRPDYLRKWIAKPQSILPYTGMPVNIAYDPDKPFTGSVVPQNLYHGDSIDQLDALVDLLMNYDMFARQRSPIQPLVAEQQQQAAEAGQPTGSEAPANGNAPTTDEPAATDEAPAQSDAAAADEASGNGT